MIKSLPTPNNDSTLDGISAMVMAKVYNRVGRSLELGILELKVTRGDFDVLLTESVDDDTLVAITMLGNNCNVGRECTEPSGVVVDITGRLGGIAGPDTLN